MRPYRSKGAKTYKVRIYATCCLSRPRTCKKPGHVKSLGIQDPDAAAALGRLLGKLRRRPKYWPLLDGLKDERFTGANLLYHSTVKGGLRRLMRSLSDADLEPLVETWYKALAKQVAQDTRDHYKSAVRLVIPAMKPFPASKLTASFLQDTIDGWDVEPATARKRGMGIRRFTHWLKRKQLIRRDPMRDVELPTAGDPRDKHVELWEHLRLADAQPSPYREFSAMLAAGFDVSTLFAVRRRDVDTNARAVYAPGTKTWTRKRVIRIPDDVWPYVERAIAGLSADARLFQAIPDRWAANNQHRLAIYGDAEHDVKGLIELLPALSGYQMRDARHTYAVRAVRAGVSLELVARQLGHKNSLLVQKVYGRYEPSREERDRAERMASAADAQRKQERGQ